MNAWQFMTGSPWLTFFLALIVGEVITRSVQLALRHWSIRRQGYPPPHCDADGDPLEQDD